MSVVQSKPSPTKACAVQLTEETALGTDNNNGLLTQVLAQPALRTEAVQQIVAAMNNAQRDQQIHGHA